MSEQPIIIKRIKKGGHGAHHGGSWKLAYADFVTAMMAFFLLLWLLNSVTEEQLQGIADYFAPTTASQSSSGAGGMLGGKVVGEGAEESNGNTPSFTETLPPPSVGNGGEATTDPTVNNSSQDNQGPGANTGVGSQTANGQSASSGQASAQQVAAAAAAQEEQNFQKAEANLKQAINSIPELAKLANSLMVDDTPEGLRIQLVDQDGLAMFPSGAADMYGHTRALLTMVGKVINQLPEKISIAGNTDATPYAKGAGYTNWELSSDRALAARRVLNDAGVPMSRVERVEGLADSDLLDKANPTDPRNRRISIVLLRQNPDTGSVSVNSKDLQSGTVPAAMNPGAASAPAAAPAAAAPLPPSSVTAPAAAPASPAPAAPH